MCCNISWEARGSYQWERCIFSICHNRWCTSYLRFLSKQNWKTSQMALLFLWLIQGLGACSWWQKYDLKPSSDSQHCVSLQCRVSWVPWSHPALQSLMQRGLRAVGPVLLVTPAALAKLLQDTGLSYSSMVAWVSFGLLWCPAALSVHLEPMLWPGCRRYFDLSGWKRGTGQL